MRFTSNETKYVENFLLKGAYAFPGKSYLLQAGFHQGGEFRPRGLSRGDDLLAGEGLVQHARH